MLMTLYAGALAIAFGLAGASLLRWIYVLITGEMLGYRHLVEPGFYQPVRALAVMMSGPEIMFSWSLRMLESRQPAGVLVLLLSFGWSFILGVVILTKIFGYS